MEPLDLRKEQVLDLAKGLGISNQKSEVVFVADFSSSMKDLYKDGTIQRTVERILPIGLALDDNELVDFFAFDRKSMSLPAITKSNYTSIVDTHLSNYGNMGGTDYGPVLEHITRSKGIKLFQKISFLNSLFGNKPTQKQPFKFPVFIIMLTDGDTENKESIRKIITEMANYGFFIQFIGLTCNGSSFGFLKDLDTMSGRLIDNANFFEIHDLDKIPDTKLYDLILQEYPLWLPLARKHKLIL